MKQMLIDIKQIIFSVMDVKLCSYTLASCKVLRPQLSQLLIRVSSAVPFWI